MLCKIKVIELVRFVGSYIKWQIWVTNYHPNYMSYVSFAKNISMFILFYFYGSFDQKDLSLLIRVI